MKYFILTVVLLFGVGVQADGAQALPSSSSSFGFFDSFREAIKQSRIRRFVVRVVGLLGKSGPMLSYESGGYLEVPSTRQELLVDSNGLLLKRVANFDWESYKNLQKAFESGSYLTNLQLKELAYLEAEYQRLKDSIGFEAPKNEASDKQTANLATKGFTAPGMLMAPTGTSKSSDTSMAGGSKMMGEDGSVNAQQRPDPPTEPRAISNAIYHASAGDDDNLKPPPPASTPREQYVELCELLQICKLLQICESLQKGKVNVNAALPANAGPSAGLTPLQVLIMTRAPTEQHVEMFRLLLESGADVNAVFPAGTEGYTGLTPLQALMWIAPTEQHLKMLQLLQDAKREQEIKSRFDKLVSEQERLHSKYQQLKVDEFRELLVGFEDTNRVAVGKERMVEFRGLENTNEFRIISTYREFIKKQCDERTGSFKSETKERESVIKEADQLFSDICQSGQKERQLLLNKEQKKAALEQRKKSEAGRQLQEAQMAQAKAKKDLQNLGEFAKKELENQEVKPRAAIVGEEQAEFKNFKKKLDEFWKKSCAQINNQCLEEERCERMHQEFSREWEFERRQLVESYLRGLLQIKQTKIAEAENAWQEYIAKLLRELEGAPEEELTLESSVATSAVHSDEVPSANVVETTEVHGPEISNLWINWRHIFEGHNYQPGQLERSAFLPRFCDQDELRRAIQTAVAQGRFSREDDARLIYEYRFPLDIGFSNGRGTRVLRVVLEVRSNKATVVTAYPVPENL